MLVRVLLFLTDARSCKNIKKYFLNAHNNEMYVTTDVTYSPADPALWEVSDIQ